MTALNMYCTLWSKTPYFLNNSVQNEPILIIFGTRNSENIWHRCLCIRPPYLKNVTALWNADLVHLIEVLFPRKKVNGFENSRYSSLNCRQATAQDKVMNGFGSLMLAGHISRLMNDVSRGTEAWSCHERDILMHCLAGRQTLLH